MRAVSSSSRDPLLEMYEIWRRLHEVTKENLGRFEKADFRLSQMVTGAEAVSKLVGYPI